VALSDPLAVIVFTGYNHDNTYNIVNGNIVIRDEILTGYDKDEIVNRANELEHILSKNLYHQSLPGVARYH